MRILVMIRLPPLLLTPTARVNPLPQLPPPPPTHLPPPMP